MKNPGGEKTMVNLFILLLRLMLLKIKKGMQEVKLKLHIAILRKTLNEEDQSLQAASNVITIIVTPLPLTVAGEGTPHRTETY